MKIAPKKPITEFEPPFEKQIEDILRNDPYHAYHTTRIMVDYFGVKEEDMGNSFTDWKDKKDIALWRKVRNALHLLVEQGKVEMRKDGKINYFWWSNHRK
jgi:hypothetical protein